MNSKHNNQSTAHRSTPANIRKMPATVNGVSKSERGTADPNWPKTKMLNAKFNTQGIEVKGIVSGAAVGLLLGAIYAGVSQVAKISFQPTIVLDPRAENMEDIAPDLAGVFRFFMGSYYRICSNKYKPDFKVLIQEAIRSAEAVMCIEVQIKEREVKPLRGYRAESTAHARRCLRKLRESRKYFDTEIIHQITEHINFISVYLADHLQNIRNLTEELYPGKYE